MSDEWDVYSVVGMLGLAFLVSSAVWWIVQWVRAHCSRREGPE